MEFKISTDLSVFKQPIMFNSDELKTELANRLERYNSLVVTEDSIRDAKADRATLNKLRDVMETKRKEIKTQCEEPYRAFKAQYDEVLAMIDKPIAAIDGQVKVFDERRKEEKLAEITKFWNDNVGKLAEYISFARVFNTKWANATYKMTDITDEIMAAFCKVEDDLTAIRGIGSDFELTGIEEYTTSGNLNAALGKMRALEDRRKAEEERKAVAEAARATAPAEMAPQPVEEVTHEAAPRQQTETPKITVLDFRVHVTDAQMASLRDFLVKNGIKFGRVPREGL